MMRRVKLFLWGVALTGVWLLTSSDIAPETYSGWVPYFMQRTELEKSVFMATENNKMVNPGKIWVADNTLYVVERYKGVHIIDNADPAHPRQTGFIVAPGCMDVAVKGGIIYLDNAVDLVAFDLATGKETKRLKNYFPEPSSPSGIRYKGHSEKMILVGWKQQTVNQEGRP